MPYRSSRGEFNTWKVSGIAISDRPSAGRAFFVGNSTDNTDTVTATDDVTSYGTIKRPFATLDYAINQCVASRGDTIYVLEGHAESLTSTAVFVPDIAGISIIGLGEGSNRPTFTTGAGSTGANATIIGITGAGTKISNMIFRAGDQAGSSGVCIGIGADDVTIEGCRFDHSTSATYFSHTIEVSSGSDRAKILDNDFANFGTTGQTGRAIDFNGTGGNYHCVIQGNTFIGSWLLDGVIGSSTDLVARGLVIADNFINNNSTIGSDACIYMPSSQNINGGGGNSIINNVMLSGSSGSSTQVCVAPYFRYGHNATYSSSGLQGITSGLTA